jgi:glycerol-3-phosphate acyltransferase PlsY
MPPMAGNMPLDQTMIVVALFGYLLGSIPFGLLLTRLAGLGDIRNVGSGNIGATNVLRTGNKFIAVLTLLLDGGKGAAAVLITQVYAPEATLVAALAVFAGHLYPVWLKFKGGKGVATFAGICLAYDPMMGLVYILAWILTAIISRYSSLAALAAALVGPVYAGLFLTDFASSIFALIAVLIFWRHSDNIRRLVDGKEPKIGKS